MKLLGLLVTDRKALVENEIDGLLNEWMIWNAPPFYYPVGVYVDIDPGSDISRFLPVKVWFLGPKEDDVKLIRTLEASPQSKFEAVGEGSQIRLGFQWRLETDQPGEYVFVAGVGEAPAQGDLGWPVTLR